MYKALFTNICMTRTQTNERSSQKGSVQAKATSDPMQGHQENISFALSRFELNRSEPIEVSACGKDITVTE